GLAASDWGIDRVNLLPAKFLERKRRRGSVIALAVILSAFLLANAGLFQGLRGAANRYRDVLANYDSVTRSMALTPEESARWAEFKSALGEAMRGEQAYAPAFTRWKALLGALGASAPAEMRLLSAEFTPGPPGTAGSAGGRAELRGIVFAASPADAQRLVNGFLLSLRSQPVVMDAEYSPLELRPRAGEAKSGYEQEFLLKFTMRER
ncbi:MAG: hypothetical protein AB1346_11585, partial [Thermodesulfobacteriota bacterium]